jgi:hypothetical protein
VQPNGRAPAVSPVASYLVTCLGDRVMAFLQLVDRSPQLGPVLRRRRSRQHHLPLVLSFCKPPAVFGESSMFVLTEASCASIGGRMPDFWLTLALVGIPGIFGGLTNSISAIVKPADSGSLKSDSATVSPAHGLGFYAAHAVTGLGGALAALLVILWAGKFPADLSDLQALLTLTCTGFIAGYIAIRLLPAIADRFYKQFADLKEQQEQLKEQQTQLARKTDEGLKNAVSLTTELTKAIDYLSAGNFDAPGQTQKLIASLSSLAQAYPTNRTLNILLARLWNEALKDRQKAINVLENYAKAKLQAGEKDYDLATAYWNIANYDEDDFKKAADPNLRAQAVAALRNALDASRAYLTEFQNDPDFEDLRKSDAGKKLLADFAGQ